MYDDFDNSTYEGKVNTSLWNADLPAGKIFQQNGLLTFELSNYEGQIGISTTKSYKPVSPIFVESKIMLDRTSRNATMWVGFGSSAMGKGIACTIFAPPPEQQDGCTSELELPDVPQKWYVVNMPLGIWHIIRTEFYPDIMTFVFLVDGNKIGSYVPQNPEKFKDLSYAPFVFAGNGTDAAPSATGYVDYVRIGKIEESATKQAVYRWDFNNSAEGWGGDFRNQLSIPQASDTYLTFKSTGDDPYISSPDSLQISAAATPIITIRKRVIQGQGTEGRIYFVTSQDKNWDGKKSATFLIKNDGTFQTYNISMSESSGWQGMITQLRLDPVDNPNGVNANVEMAIDYISVHAP